MQKTTFSDYELLSTLNDARTILWMNLAEQFSSIPRKQAALAFGPDGSAPLPDDFYTLADNLPAAGLAVNGLIVTGGGGEAQISYYSLPEHIDDPIAGVFETPLSLVLETVEIAALLAKGETRAARETALLAAARFGQKRERRGLSDTKPFS
ncbi:MAG: hypothetical protein LBR71_06675 [Synergistaceae bacterium]|jgi:hypothetical protein|nr:hypothetical protein [Synergistaceae bacterium]